MAQSTIPVLVTEDEVYQHATCETFRKIAEGWNPHARAIIWVTIDEYNALFSGRAKLKAIEVAGEEPDTFAGNSPD